MRRLALIILASTPALFAQGSPAQERQVSKTDRLNFPTGGTLKIPESIGELTIEGWDDPILEITTIEWIKIRGDKPPRIDPKQLDRITVKAERKDNEVVVTTVFPKHLKIARPFTGLSDFELQYRIKAPRDAGLDITHQIGNVNIAGMTSDIRATDGMGQITIQVVPGTLHAIDARSKLGAVDSDLAGQEKKRLKFGHTFMNQAPPGTKQLFLRIGFGDIAIFDTPAPVQPK